MKLLLNKLTQAQLLENKFNVLWKEMNMKNQTSK